MSPAAKELGRTERAKYCNYTKTEQNQSKTLTSSLSQRRCEIGKVKGDREYVHIRHICRAAALHLGVAKFIGPPKGLIRRRTAVGSRTTRRPRCGQRCSIAASVWGNRQIGGRAKRRLTVVTVITVLPIVGRCCGGCGGRLLLLLLLLDEYGLALVLDGYKNRAGEKEFYKVLVIPLSQR